MGRSEITSGQETELLVLARRLTPDEYQARHRWLVQITDPSFDITLLDGVLTPTTFGSAIEPPYPGCTLIADGPGDELLDVTNLELIPILVGEEKVISFAEAVKRSVANPETNWGQRAALKVRDAGNAGKISEEVWPIGVYAVFGKTNWRFGASSLAWYVIRNRDGFFCHCNVFCGYFTFKVRSYGRLLRPRK